MEETTNTTKSTAGKGLGIAGMILGILATIISFIPCLGTFALIPGVIGLILSIVSLVQANKAGAPKGMAIAGLVCSLVGCAIAGWQWYEISKAASEAGLDKLKDAMENLDTAKLRQDMEAAMQGITDSLQAH